MNYLPLTLNLDPTTPEEKKETSIIIQQKPIMKVSETEKIVPQKPLIWRRMIDKFKGNLPGIGKLLTAGLVTAVPALKPGLALANTIIDTVAGQQQVPMNIS